MCASKITQASAPRSSSAIQSTIEWPPISSSPSQPMRTLTGRAPSAASRSPPPSGAGRAGPCRRRRRARTATRRGSSARTAGTPIRRAAPAAGRRSARRRERSAPTRRRARRAARRSRAGGRRGRRARTRRRPTRTKPHTHSPARRTSSVCDGSALTLGIRRSSESSSSQAGSRTGTRANLSGDRRVTVCTVPCAGPAGRRRPVDDPGCSAGNTDSTSIDAERRGFRRSSAICRSERARAPGRPRPPCA